MIDKLSYLGGLIDGEGCFTFCKGRNQAVNPSFSLASTSDVIVVFLVDFLKEHKIVHSVTATNRNDGSKPYKTVAVRSSKNLGVFIDLVYPYLLEKAPQAALLKEFIQVRGQHAQNNMDWTKTEHLVSNIRQLNKRGV